MSKPIDTIKPGGAEMDVASYISGHVDSTVLLSKTPGQRDGAGFICRLLAALRLTPGGEKIVTAEALADIVAACQEVK